MCYRSADTIVDIPNICKKNTSLQLCVRTMWWYQSSKTAKNHLGNFRWGHAYDVLTSWL